MKILVLNPFWESEHPSLQALRKRGWVFVLAHDPAEALQVLKMHGRSIEIAIVHREGALGQGEPGLEFVSWFKQDQDQSDLPYILTSSQWGEAQFASHQATAIGANAYLELKPGTNPPLGEQVLAIFGEEANTDVSAVMPKMSDEATAQITSDLVLEDAVTEDGLQLESSPGLIQLDGPQLEIPAAVSLAHENPTSLSIDLPEAMLPALELAPSEPELELAPSEISVENPQSVVMPPVRQAEHEIPTAHSGIDLAAPTEVPAASVPAPPDQDLEVDAVIGEEMPYLLTGTSHRAFQDPKSLEPKRPRFDSLEYVQPVGDAVVPGGAATSPDQETLKKYLLLREQDVAALSSQLKVARDQIQSLETLLKEERAAATLRQHEIDEQARRIQEYDREKTLALQGLQAEIEELKFQAKSKSDRARALESQVHEATQETEKLKERVRSDIRKIRVREKELENRLEIMKKDTEALLSSRESKIIELKRKIDLLEFNLDLAQDQNTREREESSRLRERLNRALQAVRVAGGLLDHDVSPPEPESRSA
jgi:hypothetical protein